MPTYLDKDGLNHLWKECIKPYIDKSSIVVDTTWDNPTPGLLYTVRNNKILGISQQGLDNGPRKILSAPEGVVWLETTGDALIELEFNDIDQIYVDCKANEGIYIDLGLTSPATKISFTGPDYLQLIKRCTIYADTSQVTSMVGLFNGWTSLESLDINSLDTSSVTDMSEMFRECNKLTSLDVSNFDTSNVANMSEIFRNCFALTILNLSNWNTSKVTQMNGMFWYCKKLSSLDLSNWNTSSVTNMGTMFAGCTFDHIDLSHFNTSKVTSISYLFTGCPKLTNIDLSSWDSSNMITINAAFSNCSNLTTLTMPNSNFNKVTLTTSLFNNCGALTTLNWPTMGTVGLDVADTQSITIDFTQCPNLRFDGDNLNIFNYDRSSYGQPLNIYITNDQYRSIPTNDEINTDIITTRGYSLSAIS